MKISPYLIIIYTVRKVLADFVVLYVTDNAIAKHYVTDSLVKYCRGK